MEGPPTAAHAALEDLLLCPTSSLAHLAGRVPLPAAHISPGVSHSNCSQEMQEALPTVMLRAGVPTMNAQPVSDLSVPEGTAAAAG